MPKIGFAVFVLFSIKNKTEIIYNKIMASLYNTSTQCRQSIRFGQDTFSWPYFAIPFVGNLLAMRLYGTKYIAYIYLMYLL